MNEVLTINQKLKVFCIDAASKMSTSGNELVITADTLFNWLLDKDGSSCNDNVSVDKEGKTISYTKHDADDRIIQRERKLKSK